MSEFITKIATDLANKPGAYAATIRWGTEHVVGATVTNRSPLAEAITERHAACSVGAADLFNMSECDTMRVIFGEQDTAHCVRMGDIRITVLLLTGHPFAKSVLRSMRRAGGQIRKRAGAVAAL